MNFSPSFNNFIYFMIFIEIGENEIDGRTASVGGVKTDIKKKE